MPTDPTRVFPDAISADEFRARLHARAQHAGFEPGEALLILGSCRDELCFVFGDALQERWGSAFHIGSLAGMAFLGRTGMGAAAHHVPEGERRRRYLVVALTHIGVGEDGEPGRVRRPGQLHESSACGALVALRDEIASGVPMPELDPDDLEQGLLRRRLVALRDRVEPPTIVDVTLAARDAIREDVVRVGGDLDLDGAADVLLATGVLVHTAEGDWVGAHELTRVGTDRVPVTLDL